jgi:hypothetical protein
LLTLENWGDILQLCFRTSINKFLTAIYLFSWIFIGNFVFLNLFLAILIDGFTHELDFEKSKKNEITDDKVFEEIEKQILASNPDILEEKNRFEY